MDAVGTANASDIPSSLIGNAFGQPQSGQRSAANVASSYDRGPATLVDLSDQVRHVLARAISDRGIADRLRDFVEQRGLNGAKASDQNASADHDAATDIAQAFEQLSGGTFTLGGSDGVSVQSYQSENKEYITFSDSKVAATNVIASSNASTVSAASVGTQTGSLTFVVDFATGAISMEQAESNSVATSMQISSSQSAFSTLV